jgi:hypothetical protein
VAGLETGHPPFHSSRDEYVRVDAAYADSLVILSNGCEYFTKLQMRPRRAGNMWVTEKKHDFPIFVMPPDLSAK